MKRVLRYEVVIDDQPHEVPRGVPVLMERKTWAGVPSMPVIDVWFEIHVPGADWNPAEYEPQTQKVQIVGTGQPVPDAWRWLRSYVDGGLVWHLYEVRP